MDLPVRKISEPYIDVFVKFWYRFCHVFITFSFGNQLVLAKDWPWSREIFCDVLRTSSSRFLSWRMDLPVRKISEPYPDVFVRFWYRFCNVFITFSFGTQLVLAKRLEYETEIFCDVLRTSLWRFAKLKNDVQVQKYIRTLSWYFSKSFITFL